MTKAPRAKQVRNIRFTMVCLMCLSYLFISNTVDVVAKLGMENCLLPGTLIYPTQGIQGHQPCKDSSRNVSNRSSAQSNDLPPPRSPPRLDCLRSVPLMTPNAHPSLAPVFETQGAQMLTEGMYRFICVIYEISE